MRDHEMVPSTYPNNQLMWSKKKLSNSYSNTDDGALPYRTAIPYVICEFLRLGQDQ